MDASGQLEIIPAVDVLGDAVVRLVEGDYERSTRYGDDPVEVVTRWIDQGAGIVHVVDLDGARAGTTNMDLWRRLGDRGLRIQAGGGIRSADDARAVLEAGADRVVMGTTAVWNPTVLTALGERVVAAVDVRDGRATGQGWLDEGRPVAAVLDGLAEAGIARLLVTGIGRDGTMTGPDIEVTGGVVADPRFSVIASGGVGALEDLAPLASLGCEAVVVGRALYEGRFTLPEAIEITSTLA